MKKSLHFFVIVFLFSLMNISLIAQEFSTGKMTVTLSDAGRIRIKNNVADTNMVDRISVLVGGNKNQVFTYNADADVVSGDSSYSILNPQQSDFEIRTSCDNSYSGLPPNVKVNTNVYGWNNTNYAIVKMVVTNQETSNLDIRFGLEVIPEIDGAYGFETVKLDESSKSVLIYTTNKSSRAGLRMLSTPMVTLKTIDWVDSYDTNDVDMWNWITTGTLQPTYTTSLSDAVVTFISVAPQSVASQRTHTYYFSMSYAANEASVMSGLDAAQTKYNSSFTSVEKTKELPIAFALAQNYPNPFNPTTKINFALAKTGFVNLSVYNILGQKVAELVNSNMTVGNYTVDFNASKLASGIYIYRLTTPSQSITKKMSLLK
jgi:hypothetical protein